MEVHLLIRTLINLCSPLSLSLSHTHTHTLFLFIVFGTGWGVTENSKASSFYKRTKYALLNEEIIYRRSMTFRPSPVYSWAGRAQLFIPYLKQLSVPSRANNQWAKNNLDPLIYIQLMNSSKRYTVVVLSKCK